MEARSSTRGGRRLPFMRRHPLWPGGAGAPGASMSGVRRLVEVGVPGEVLKSGDSAHASEPV